MAPVMLEDKIIDLNADQFLGCLDAGLFPAESGLYLWDGRVVEKRTPDGLEDRIVDLTADQFLGMVEAGLFPDGSRSTLGREDRREDGQVDPACLDVAYGSRESWEATSPPTGSPRARTRSDSTTAMSPCPI